MSKLKNALTYMEYVDAFNTVCNDFRNTPSGPIAKAEGRWYSVNGVKGDIMDVRTALTSEELLKYKVSNQD